MDSSEHSWIDLAALFQRAVVIVEELLVDCVAFLTSHAVLIGLVLHLLLTKAPG